MCFSLGKDLLLAITVERVALEHICGAASAPQQYCGHCLQSQRQVRSLVVFAGLFKIRFPL